MLLIVQSALAHVLHKCTKTRWLPRWLTAKVLFLHPPPPQLVKNLPAMLETWVRFLGWEDPLEKGSPLQFYGLENSIECIVQGLTKSQTRVSDFHFHF